MSQAGLLRTRRFYPLFWTQFFGAFNDNFLKNALVILITFRASSVLGIPPAQMVAASGGIFILPFFLFSATAGQLADKYDKAKIIHWIKAVEILIMVLAAVGFMTGRFGFLFGVLFLMGLHSTFFGPLKYSILPQHLAPGELIGGNALIEAGTFLAILLGTIAGGVLISIEGRGPLIVSGGLIAVALAGWLISLLIPEARPAEGEALEIQWNPLRPTVEIIRFARQTRPVFLSILGISWFWFFGAAVLSMFPPYCKDVLKTDQGVVTAFLAIFSIGIGAGSMLCERLSRQRLELGLVPLGSIGISVFAADLFFVGAPTFSVVADPGSVGIADLLVHAAGLRILLDLLLLSIFSGFFIVPLYTLIQERSAPSHRSRIIAANNILNACFMVAASLMLMGMMRAGLSIPQMFLVLAVLNAAVATYIYSILPEFLLRFLAWGLANMFYRLQVTGEGRIPKEGAAVLVCNHVSFVDWLLIGAAVHRPVRFIMDHSFQKGIVTRMLLRQAKVIPIASAKEDPALLEAAFRKAGEELRAGELVCIFPEGRITHDGQVNPFKKGVERLIHETPVPVIPLALRGVWGSLFSREGGRAILKWPKRFWARIEIRIGDPIPARDVSAQGLQDTVLGLRGGVL